MYYAGIGSRETPPEFIPVMSDVAEVLARNGWHLRSGAALAADSAFEAGANRVNVNQKEIYIPWNNYWNGAYDANGAKIYRSTREPGVLCIESAAAMALAEQYHPNWGKCSQGARKLHCRNGFILLGPQLVVPVNFIICWTPGGKVSGGTGQGLRMAADRNIQVYNLAIPEHLNIILGWIAEARRR